MPQLLLSRFQHSVLIFEDYDKFDIRCRVLIKQLVNRKAVHNKSSDISIILLCENIELVKELYPYCLFAGDISEGLAEHSFEEKKNEEKNEDEEIDKDEEDMKCIKRDIYEDIMLCISKGVDSDNEVMLITKFPTLYNDKLYL